MVQTLNGGLKTGQKYLFYGPKCPVFKWSAQSLGRPFDNWSKKSGKSNVQFSVVRYSDGNCTVTI